MASRPNMTAPICLVENSNEHLSVNQEALEILGQISEPVVVVAIVGLYRTGKSYLMNRLAGQNHGFPLGSTVQSKTKGIWMWCLPHPYKPDCTLVLLDTEGLGDVEKGDSKNDSWIFALAVLLSSMFVYNSMSTINHQALEQLHYVTELTELIRAKSSPTPDGVEDSIEFVSFFPDFIWAVRDFILELELNGHPITEDEYLENALKLIPGLNLKAQISNLPRECIRHFFPRRKCFVFDRPINDKELLAHIEKISEYQLDPKFKEQTKNFCSYILTQARTKTLKEGITVTGKRLRTLVVTYVDAINSGAVPCLENAVTTLAQLENSGAVQKAANHYSEQMAQRVNFPTDTLQELLDLHAACEKEAIAIFMEHSFKDDNQVFQKNLVEIIKDKQDKILLQNEEASVKFCQEKLEQLSKSLMEGISAGIFSVPGGHKLYMETKERLEQDYWQVPRKGVKAHEVLQRFLQSQAATENSILQADKALTDVEKAMAAERAKKEAAEKNQELLRQKLQEQQQQMEAQERSLQENILQLKEKMERDRETIVREQNMMLEHKLKVQEDLLREGFKNKSEQMNAEINHLRNKIDTAQKDNTSWIEKAIDVLSILCNTGLRTLVVTYVDAINSGAVPCLENAVTTLAQLENSGAIQKAANHYSEQMAQRVSFPTDTLQELLDLHAACEKEAIAIFMEHSFKDDNHGFQKNLVEIMKDKKDEFLLQNEEASVKFCQEKLEQLSMSLMEDISAGIFSVPGGHKLYMETKERLEQDYWQVPRKGVKAHEVLQRFLQSQAATENSILQSDKALTDVEKAMAAERAKKEAAEKEQELMKQKLQEQQQQMEAQERSLQENILQLKEKMERDRENILREQNMMLEHKLKVQEDLLREGFKKKSEEMNAEINHLRNMIDTAQNDNTSWIEKAVDVFSILVGPGKFFRIVQGIGLLLKRK